MVPRLLSRRAVAAGVLTGIPAFGGCVLPTGRFSDGPNCLEGTDAETVSCIANHPEVDHQPTTAPLVWGCSDQAFVLRNRSQVAFHTGTAGIGVFERVSNAWQELGDPMRRTATGAIVPSGRSLTWEITFSEAADDISVTEYEVALPPLDDGVYAVVASESFQSGENANAGSVFEIRT